MPRSNWLRYAFEKRTAIEQLSDYGVDALDIELVLATFEDVYTLDEL
jgi:hypothetical protein